LRPAATIALGVAATLAMGALYHGPGGGGRRLAAGIEQDVRATLDHYEMTAVEARLQRDPLRRRLLLSGPADSFQRREIARLLDARPGVGQVQWVDGAAR